MISQTVLVSACGFARTPASASRSGDCAAPGVGYGASLDARQVADAIGRGLAQGGRPGSDLCPLEPEAAETAAAAPLLDTLGFKGRMKTARAVVIAVERLSAQTLRGGLACEVATRARQGGVPAYAIAADDELGAFGARMLDLQVIVRARSRSELVRAGSTLAGLV